MSVLARGKIFDSHIYELSSLFLGLSLFAVPLIMWDEWEIVKGKYQYLIYTFIGVAIVSIITYLNQNSVGGSMDIGNLNIGVCIYVFLIAAIAISAMTFSTFHPLFFASAAIILIALQLLKRYLEQKQN